MSKDLKRALLLMVSLGAAFLFSYETLRLYTAGNNPLIFFGTVLLASLAPAYWHPTLNPMFHQETWRWGVLVLANAGLWTWAPSISPAGPLMSAGVLFLLTTLTLLHFAWRATK